MIHQFNGSSLLHHLQPHQSGMLYKLRFHSQVFYKMPVIKAKKVPIIKAQQLASIELEELFQSCGLTATRQIAIYRGLRKTDFSVLFSSNL